MTLLEINLKKPALIEERTTAESEREKERRADEYATSARTSSGRSKAKPLLGLLLTAVVVGLVGRKVRSRRGSGASDEYAEPDERTVETDGSETGGTRRGPKLAGLLGGLVALALVARKLRGRSSN